MSWMTKSEMIYTDFMKDIEAYLNSKFEGVPNHVILEVSAYIATRCAVMANDLTRIACTQYENDLRRHFQRSARNKVKGETEE